MRYSTWCAVAIVTVGLLRGAVTAAGQEPAIPAAQVKAAFVYNFTKFVTWPANAFVTAEQPIRLGIVGDDALAAALRVVEGRVAQGRKVEVKRLGPGDDLADCHLVYVAISEQARFVDVLGRSAAAPVLTIGDAPGFTAAGGIVNFFVDGDRVRIEVSADRASARGLKISSKLLQVARVVDKGH